MTRPADMPTNDRWPHGVRARYACGCRCFQCRRANSRYETERAAARKAGDWNGLVDAAPMLRHLRKLSRQGVGYKTAADAANVSKTVLAQVLNGTKTRVRARTARRVLDVTADAIADHATVPATTTHRLVAKLLEEGFTKAELARRLGYKAPALHVTYSKRVLAKTELRIKRFYRSVMM